MSKVSNKVPIMLSRLPVELTPLVLTHLTDLSTMTSVSRALLPMVKQELAERVHQAKKWLGVADDDWEFKFHDESNGTTTIIQVAACVAKNLGSIDVDVLYSFITAKRREHYTFSVGRDTVVPLDHDDQAKAMEVFMDIKRRIAAAVVDQREIM